MCVCVYIYVYMYMYMYVYIYIYIERERDIKGADLHQWEKGERPGPGLRFTKLSPYPGKAP